MKKILFLLLLLDVFESVKAQVPSSCNVPPQLYQAYERDIKNMVVRRMYELQHPDTALIPISQNWQDTIVDGMAAIANSGIVEADSVFNLYCVHDNTSPMSIYNGFLVNVDTSFSWTSAWQNLTALTGNTVIDGLVTSYGLQVTQFYNFSFGNFALVYTDSLLNMYALMDSLETVPGVIYAEPDAIIGSAGKIVYAKAGSERYYDFYFEFNDCFDGCDNYHVWHFKVNDNCSVEYLGFDDWGVFGISPLPPPTNCNILSSVNNMVNTRKGVHMFPNPSNGTFNISLDKIAHSASIQIINPLGSIIFEDVLLGEQEKSIGLKDISPGIYFIIIDDGEKSFKRTIVIQ